MIKKFVLYNFKYFFKKRKESEYYSWFLATSFTALGFTFNVATIFFFILGAYYSNIKFEYPSFVLIVVPWVTIFFFIFLNKSFKNKIIQESREPIDQKMRIIFWIYYITSLIIYSYAMSFYSARVY